MSIADEIDLARMVVRGWTKAANDLVSQADRIQEALGVSWRPDIGNAAVEMRDQCNHINSLMKAAAELIREMEKKTAAP